MTDEQLSLELEKLRALILAPGLEDKFYQIQSAIVHISFHLNGTLSSTAKDLGVTDKTIRSYLKIGKFNQELVDHHMNLLEADFWFNQLDEKSKFDHLGKLQSLYGTSADESSPQ